MPRGPDCPVCVSPQRAEMEAALAAGEPMRVVAERLGVSKDAVWRHVNGRHAERDARLAVDQLPDEAPQPPESRLDGPVAPQLPATAPDADRPAPTAIQGSQRRGLSPVDVVAYVQAAAARMARDTRSETVRHKALELLLKTVDLMVRAANVSQANGDRGEAERRETVLRTALLSALAPFPEAHAAVLSALDEADRDPVVALLQDGEGSA